MIPPRVLLVDDNALVRETLAEYLRGLEEIASVHVASSPEAALDAAERAVFDVCVLDVDMPGLDSAEAGRRLVAMQPETRLLYLSGHGGPRHVERAIAAGAIGYLTKGRPPESIAAAIRDAARDRPTFSPAIAARLVIHADGLRLGAPAGRGASTVDETDRRLVQALIEGGDPAEIARAAGMTPASLVEHVRGIMPHIDAPTRSALVGIVDQVESRRLRP